MSVDSMVPSRVIEPKPVLTDDRVLKGQFLRVTGPHRAEPNLAAVGKDGRPVVGVSLDPMTLLRFVAADFNSMNEMCERAGLSERAIYDRTKEVMEYFRFPFDAPPPECRDFEDG